jgi:hypothetical protein
MAVLREQEGRESFDWRHDGDAQEEEEAVLFREGVN